MKAPRGREAFLALAKMAGLFADYDFLHPDPDGAGPRTHCEFAVGAEGLPLLRERRATSRRIRIWSAGCSTGQEAYSLAMLFDADKTDWQGWKIEIIATDISEAVLSKAREARYCQFEIQRGLSVDYMLRYFTQEEGDWVLNPEIRELVTFRQDNLVQPASDLGVFDLILCRNVLMYFGTETREVAYRRLASAIASDGLLMLGAAETVLGATRSFTANSTIRGLYAPTGRPADTLPPSVILV